MISIPLRYKEVKYGDAPQDIRDFFEKIKETRRGIYMYGPVGTGKTHVAIGLKKRWDETSRRSAEFWNVAELMQEIKDDFDRDAYSKSHTFARIMEDEKTLLILDDIGAEKLTDWVLERFYLIINRKYNDVMPVVFTSNYSLEELAGRLGDRIASRIVEMCDVVKVGGDDKRFTISSFPLPTKPKGE